MGVDGVEQEVGVDLRLQHLQLHRGGPLALSLHFHGGHLGGEQLGETVGDGALGLGDFARIAVVELERPLHPTADEQGLHDGSLIRFCSIGAGSPISSGVSSTSVFPRRMHSWVALVRSGDAAGLWASW